MVDITEMASRDREKDAEECKLKGNACLSAKDFDKAIEWYTQGIKLCKGHVLLSNRSAAYLSKGFSDSALKDAEECIALKPDFAKGYSRKGAALHSLGKYSEAVAAYEHGLSVDPNNPGLKQGLDSVKAAMSGPSSTGGGADPSAGLGALFGPQFIEKIRNHHKLKKYLDDPTFVQMLNMLQSNPQMLQLAAQDPRIQECFSEILGISFQSPEMGPSDEEIKAREAEKAREKQRKEEAEAAKREEEERIKRENETPEEKDKREKKESAAELKAKGNESYKKKDFEAAISLYEQAIELDPENCVFLLNIASVKLEQGDLSACIEFCDKAIELGRSVYATFEQIARAYERKGNAYVKHERYTDAIECFKKAQLENQTSAVANKLKKVELLLKKKQAEEYLDPALAAEAKEKGNVFFKEGNFPAAAELYSEAIKRDPSNAVYFGNRASAYMKLADFGRAMDDVDKALELDPKYMKMYVRKGNIHYFLKEYHKCLRVYGKALELDPENVEAKQGLAKVQYAIDSSTGEVDQQRSERALQDPEIRNILSDPVMQQVLKDLSTNPGAFQKYASNPEMLNKIQMLIAAGIIKTS